VFRNFEMQTSTLLFAGETKGIIIRGQCEKFVDWRQCTAIMQREAVTVMPSYSGGNIVVACSSSL
jgi:hypothetical protein